MFVVTAVIYFVHQMWSDFPADDPDDGPAFKRSFFVAPITVAARWALLLAILPTYAFLDNRIVFAPAILISAIAMAVGFSSGRKALDFVVGRDGERLPPPPAALGVFLLGGVALLIASKLAG